MNNDSRLSGVVKKQVMPCASLAAKPKLIIASSKGAKIKTSKSRQSRDPLHKSFISEKSYKKSAGRLSVRSKTPNSVRKSSMKHQSLT